MTNNLEHSVGRDLHGLGQLKAKTIRSWARAYSEELEAGQKYTERPPTITIAFSDGAIEVLITEKEIVNKNIIENARKEKEFIRL